MNLTSPTRLSGIMFIASDDRGDQLLYHLTAPEASSHSKQEAQAFLSQTQIYGRLAKIKSLDAAAMNQNPAPRPVPSDFDRDYPRLFDLPIDEIPKRFRPRKNLREKVLDVAINNFRFISIIVVIPDSSPEYWAQWWARVVTVVMRTLQAEQQRCSYVSSETRTLIELRQLYAKWRQQPTLRHPLAINGQSMSHINLPASQISGTTSSPPTGAHRPSTSTPQPPATSSSDQHPWNSSGVYQQPTQTQKTHRMSQSSEATSNAGISSVPADSAERVRSSSSVSESESGSLGDSSGQPLDRQGPSRRGSNTSSGQHESIISAPLSLTPLPQQPPPGPAEISGNQDRSPGQSADGLEQPVPRRLSSSAVSFGGQSVSPPSLQTEQFSPTQSMSSSEVPTNSNSVDTLSDTVARRVDSKAEECLTLSRRTTLSDFLACNNKLAFLLQEVFVTANTPHLLMAHWNINGWLRLDVSILRFAPTETLGSLVHFPQIRGTSMALSLASRSLSDEFRITPASVDPQSEEDRAVSVDSLSDIHQSGSHNDEDHGWQEPFRRTLENINRAPPQGDGPSRYPDLETVPLSPSSYRMVEDEEARIGSCAPAAPQESSEIRHWHTLLLLVPVEEALAHLKPPLGLIQAHWQAFIRSLDPTVSLGTLQRNLDLDFLQVVVMATHLCGCQLAIVIHTIQPHSRFVCNPRHSQLARWMHRCLRSKAQIARRLRFGKDSSVTATESQNYQRDYRCCDRHVLHEKFHLDLMRPEDRSTAKPEPQHPKSHDHYFERLSRLASEGLSLGICRDPKEIVVRHSRQVDNPLEFEFVSEAALNNSSGSLSLTESTGTASDVRLKGPLGHGSAASVELGLGRSDDGDECYECWFGPESCDRFASECLVDVCQLGCMEGWMTPKDSAHQADISDYGVLGQAFTQMFPKSQSPSLCQSMARWDDTKPLRSVLAPLSLDERHQCLQELVWLLRHGLVSQLHQYVHLVAMADSALAHVQHQAHRQPYIQTFRRLAPMVDGRHSVTHMINTLGVSYEAIQSTLAAFSDIAVSSFRMS